MTRPHWNVDEMDVAGYEGVHVHARRGLRATGCRRGKMLLAMFTITLAVVR